MMRGLFRKLTDEIQRGLPGKEAQRLMAPYKRVVDQDFSVIKQTAKLSAVLILLYQRDGNWYTMLMERNVYNGHHSGQISFPGGRFEVTDANLRSTAIREFEEEMGVEISENEVVGRLSELYIPPSNFYVQPYLALYNGSPKFSPEQKEVTALVPVALEDLFKAENKTVEKVVVSGGDFSLEAPAYKLGERVIWGATAMMISELEHLIKRIGL